MKLYKPTTPSRRHTIGLDYSALSKVEPYRPLLKRLKSHSGRNNRGVITTRHQGGGEKKLYRLVDFVQDKFNVPGKVETIEYDPYRSAFVVRVLYADGERRYALAPHGIKTGDTIVSAASRAPFVLGNRMPLREIPVGTQVHNIELRRGGGGKLARSAGAYAEVLAQDGAYTHLRLGSKEVRKVLSSGLASIGQMSNPDYTLIHLGKAGRSRHLGIRPTVRGSVMNPVDHPYGGGEGKQPRGTKRPKTRWGKVTGGHKTRRRKKWSSPMILQRRPKIR